MSWLEAVVLGLIQGVTEFLPVSSTAHLRIIPALVGWSDPGAAATAVIQLGTLLAMLIYFRDDLISMVVGAIRGITTGKPMEDESSRLAWYVAIGTIPVVVLGLTLKHAIETSFRNLWVIAGSLVGLSVLLIVAEVRAKRVALKAMDEIGWADAVTIGFGQALALIPGMSRSGSTIMTALFRRLDHETSARYSFLLGIPAVFGAGIFELLKQWKHLGALGWGPILLSIAVSFVVGMASIWVLLEYLKKHTTYVFIWYRIALGIALAVMLAKGIVAA